MEQIITRAKQIKLMIFDVDGIFTDGRIYFTSNGEEFISFHIHDGLGIKRLLHGGIQVAIVSGRNLPMVHQRMVYLGIQHIYLGQNDKAVVVKKLLADLNLSRDQAAYMGDDLPDIKAMNVVDLRFTVPNAQKKVTEYADWQTTHLGGHGAVREICELLLSAQGKDPDVN